MPAWRVKVSLSQWVWNSNKEAPPRQLKLENKSQEIYLTCRKPLWILILYLNSKYSDLILLGQLLCMTPQRVRQVVLLYQDVTVLSCLCCLINFPTHFFSDSEVVKLLKIIKMFELIWTGSCHFLHANQAGWYDKSAAITTANKRNEWRLRTAWARLNTNTGISVA